MEKYYISIASLVFPSWRVSATASHPAFSGPESGSVKVKLVRVCDCLLFTDSRAGVQLFDVNRLQTQLLLCLLYENPLPGRPACGSLKSR